MPSYMHNGQRGLQSSLHRLYVGGIGLIAAVLAAAIGLVPAKAQPVEKSGRQLAWYFPLPSARAGILLGDGKTGVMVWGGDSVLNITLSAAGFWLQKGNARGFEGLKADSLNARLEMKDEAGLKSYFARFENMEGGMPRRPFQLGGATFSFRLNWRLEGAKLNLETDELVLWGRPDLKHGLGKGLRKWIGMRLDGGKLVVDGLPRLRNAKVTTAYEAEAGLLRSWGVSAPFVQIEKEKTTVLQSDLHGKRLKILAQESMKFVHFSAVVLDSGVASGAHTVGFSVVPLAKKNKRIERAERDKHLKVMTADGGLNAFLKYGTHTLRSAVAKDGPALTLQGPWMETDQLPAWGNDYHWNVNVQMCYAPMLRAGQAGHMMPLWKMLSGWMNQMKANGKALYGCDSCMVLPHATDNECRPMGNYWPGAMDPAGLAWVVKLGWDYYRYTGDRAMALGLLLPMAEGNLNTFLAMGKKEMVDGKERFALPYSASAEWRASRPDAWGKNSSYQLAAMHSTMQILGKLRKELRLGERNGLETLKQVVPKYSTMVGPRYRDYEGQNNERIAIWEGMDLVESHRHHSHLGAIYPFMTLSEAEKTSDLLRNSVRQWAQIGSGLWAGWSHAWAAELMAEMGDVEGGLYHISALMAGFRNAGGNTVHDPTGPGVNATYRANARERNEAKGKPKLGEIMQLDGMMGGLSAVLNMLVVERNDSVFFRDRYPAALRNVNFSNLRLPRGLVIDGKIRNGQIARLKLEKENGGTIVVMAPKGVGGRRLRKGFDGKEAISLKEKTVEKYSFADEEFPGGVR